MVITLDNGQTVTIYEDSNLLRDIEPYIDKEIYDSLEEQFGTVQEDLARLDSLEDKIADQDEAYDSLGIDLDNLRDRYDKLEDEYNDLYEENKELEQIKDKILDEISGLSYELSEDNIEEIKSKLQDLYYKY